MSIYYIIEPEVPGGLGDNTIIDTSVHPPVISVLHFEFDGWMGDDIAESFPCYIVTERLMNAIKEHNFSGVAFDTLIMSKSGEFMNMHPLRELPVFYWMKIIGKFGTDDFAISDAFNLLISGRVIDCLRLFNTGHADIRQYVQKS
jgi:hypothetical protein